MKFITRGNSSPQGKQKIYFTGHPDDCRIYFPTISSQILKLCDCAVFYDEDPEHPEDPENFIADLDSMQLVVLAVTGNYIFGDTFAHNTVLAHAVERHIPVLPILLESELANDFSQKCGDLHCLMPNSTDVTEISYEEKLKGFLESVLVGDELAGKVRAAFDAYIFLSYRKKDRRYAQELMRLIHGNDFCRDIAIWYDEFLTPGENFNDAIRAAMEKSELFALAVTPNLLEYPNYVMTEEYPAARDLGKKILPAMLLPTDENELHEHYEMLPETIDPKNTKVMSDTLAKMLENIAKRENDGDPRHNFLIGLAYLSGIDVEVDHKRAVSLIMSAAEAGLPEALEKLVSMYWTGEGVKRDHERSFEYQRRLISVRESAYKADQTDRNAADLFSAVLLLGDRLLDIGLIEDSINTYKKLMDVCNEVSRSLNDDRTDGNSAICYERLSRAHMADGELSLAKLYCTFAIETFKALSQEEYLNQAGLDMTYNYLAICHISLGDIYSSNAELDKALECYEEAERIYEDKAAEYRSNKSTVYSKLGSVYMTQRRTSEARRQYEKSLESQELLAEQTGSPEAKSDLSVIYKLLGRICKKEQDISAAYAYYKKGFEIDKELAEQSDQLKIHRNLSVSYQEMGDIFLDKGNPDLALENYKRSVEITQRLLERSETIELRLDLAKGFICLGDALKSSNYYDALDMYEKSGEIARIAAEKADTMEARAVVFGSYEKLGDLEFSGQDWDNAFDDYESCRKTAEYMVKKFNTTEALEYLSSSYEKLGALCEEINDPDTAEECHKKNVEVLRELRIRRSASVYDRAISPLPERDLSASRINPR